MLRAARHHTMAHLHFLLSELHRYQRLSAEVTLAIIHIDDLTDLMEDLHVHGHPVFVSLQDAATEPCDIPTDLLPSHYCNCAAPRCG